MEKKKAIILGGTVPHAVLIQRLNARNYETILIDYLDDSAAKPYASKHIKVSTLDKDAVLNITRKENPEFVIDACVDQANVTACYVSEKLNLPCPYSYETALDVTNKERMKKKMKEGGIPTSSYYLISKGETPSIKLPFPFVIKPIDANSSKGVFKIDNKDDFFQKLDITMSYSREGKIIVEEYASGTEIQVDCISIDGRAHVLMVKDMIPMDFGNNEMNVAGFISPGPICEKHYSQIVEIAQQIVDVFKLKTTSFFYQAKCNEKGVFVIELAARCAGGSAFESVSLRCGIDYLDLTVDAYLQKHIDLKLNINKRKIIGYFLYMKPGILDRIEGLEQQIKNGNISKVCMSSYPNMKVGKELISTYRIAIIISECDLYSKGIDRLNMALSNIKIYDKNNQDLSNVQLLKI